MNRVALLGIALALNLADAGAEARVERNVIYGMYAGTALLMDVHFPITPNGFGIVFVGGSAWSADTEYGATGLKDGAQTGIWVPPLTDAGYTVFVLNHRARPAFQYPAPVHDVQRGVRFVRYNAARFGINPARLGGTGGSSGGHLIALTGMMDGAGATADADPVNQQSAKLQTLVLRAANADMSMRPVGPAVGALLEMPAPAPNSPKTSAPWRRYQEASPLTYVTRDDPPTLLLHGDADDVVPFQHAVAFHAALEKTGVASKLVTIPRGTHGGTFGLATGASRPADWPDYMGEMVRWFDQHLKSKNATH